MNKAIDFFSNQFDRQIAEADYRLNPFEELALRYTRGGRVLDLGCGLGNFSLAAARRGHDVVALDACSKAVADLQRRADADGLPVRAEHADLAEWQPSAKFDTVVAIGLLMFFAPPAAHRGLEQIKRATAIGGTAVVNVLIEGTTFMAMFDPRAHTLFGPDELLQAFDGWHVLEHAIEDFAAPNDRIKRFATIVAKLPGESGKASLAGR